MVSFPKQDSYIFLAGQQGKLELLVSPNNNQNQLYSDNPIAIICHPHPLYDGTMNNKVVHTIHKALHTVGCETIRFNYSGVGRSEGSYGDSIGESNDLRTIITWLKQIFPDKKIILAGFSFGAFIALNVSKEIDCLQLISVAPAIPNQDYASYMPIDCPWLVIQGEQDEVIPPAKVFDFINQLDKKPDLIKFPTASHFFHGKLIDLREAIISYLVKTKNP